MSPNRNQLKNFRLGALLRLPTMVQAQFTFATNTLTGGTAYFGDPQWTNYPGRFYRLRSP